MLLAADLSANESARRVYLIAGGLVVLGLALLVLTIWFWRTTRPEHPSLAPLEIMSDRGFTKLDEQARGRRIDAVRPSPIDASVEPSPQIDLTAAARAQPVGFDDLRQGSVTTSDDDDTLATPSPSSAIDPLLVRAELDAEVDGGLGEPSDAQASISRGNGIQRMAHDTVHDRG